MSRADYISIRYTRQWFLTRMRVLNRAEQRCQQCGKPNRTFVHTVISRALQTMWWRAMKPGAAWHVRHLGSEPCGICSPDKSCSPYRIIGAGCDPWMVRVVLTMAAIDGNYSNHEESNLQALCQWCHFQFLRTLKNKKAA
jgi:5-methylcytosine-specific restriction endonuclease McrA